MLDIQFIRDNPDKVKKATKDKGLNPKVVERVLELDKQRRELLSQVEELRAKRNKLGKEDVDKGREIKKKLKDIEPQLRKVEADYEEMWGRIPNLPAKDVKTGKDEKDNEEIKKWGEIKKIDFQVKDHVELGQKLDLIDVKRAAKVSGARFGYLKNEAVFLEWALIQLALEVLVKEGFTPIIPPVLTRVSVFRKLGYSEHGGNEDYYLVYDPKKENPEEEANYYLVGTAEHSIVPYYMNETLQGKELPKRFVGFSTAFRREAGSYGKDLGGIFRVHQFDKVEMVSIVKPEDGDKEHEYLLSLEEKFFQALKIPYRVMKMCSGDLGAPTAKKYDIEAWMPSQKKYREVTSTSTTTDYQARRLNIKYKEKDKTEFVYILNGTAFAIGRTIMAIMENYQQKDGSVKIPEVLQKYVGKKVIAAGEGSKQV